MTSESAPSPSSNTPSYIGRFAPSPTGALHFGSLVSALASYLDARHFGGQWLLRIEDIDPPREEPGATEAIIRCLDAHHLFWDGDILYQSQRLEAYAEALNNLQAQQLIYPCYCTRKELAEEQGPYPGTCRQAPRKSDPAALRVLTCSLPDSHLADSGLADSGLVINESRLHLNLNFDDLFLGAYSSKHDLGDFIVRRKDGLFAYQLAVVVDDAFQNVTHVIRGADLVDCTPPQQFLFRLLSAKVPQFGHIPLVLNQQGQKLSKQNGAVPLDNNCSRDNLKAALDFLNHSPDPDLNDASEDELLAWAVQHWQRKNVLIKAGP